MKHTTKHLTTHLIEIDGASAEFRFDSPFWGEQFALVIKHLSGMSVRVTDDPFTQFAEKYFTKNTGFGGEIKR